MESLEVILISTVKFFYAPLFAIKFEFGFWETLINMCIGGFIGIFVFYYSSDFIIELFNKLLLFFNHRFKALNKTNKDKLYHRKKQRRSKKVFNRRNKLIIKLRNNYGLAGIVIMTPCLLSIPLGAILAKKYFLDNKYTLYYLLLSVVVWAFVLAGIYQKVFLL